MTQFKKLFEPVGLGKIELKNRLVMPVVSTRYMEDDGKVTQKWKDFYFKRAEGGVGMIIAAVSLKGEIRAAGIYSDEFIPGLRELTEGVHQRGAKIAAQFNMLATWSVARGAPPELVSPSGIDTPRGEPGKRPLTREEIHYLVEEIGEAARRCREAGFDAFSIHCAAGNLLGQFISTLTNKRTDEYGGDLNGRMRFLLEAFAAAKKKAGNDYTYFSKICAMENMEGGYTLEGGQQLVATLEKEVGLSLIDVGIGWHESAVPSLTYHTPQGGFIYVTEALKKATRTPVMATYRITNPLMAEQFLMRGKADVVGMGRALVADPDLPNKAKEGRLSEIRPCVGCCQCMDDAFEEEHTPMNCSVNAEVSREAEYAITPAAKPKRVLIMGGGPGGMEAARIAALRGHKVMLYERGPRLGGVMLLAGILNKELPRLLNYMKVQVQKLPIEVKVGKEVTPALIDQVKPDVVVMATGGIPPTLKWPGVSGNNVFGLSDAISALTGRSLKKGTFLKKRLLMRSISLVVKYFYDPLFLRWALQFNFPFGKEVAIVGGGFAGCELAETLIEKGKKVTLIEEAKRIGADIGRTSRWVVMLNLRKHQVKMLTSAKVEEITSQGVKVIMGDGSRVFVKANTVVIAGLMDPNQQLAHQLEKKSGKLYVIGDCIDPRRIRQAIAAGAQVAREF